MIPTLQLGGMGRVLRPASGVGSTAASILAKLGSWWEMEEASGSRVDSHGSNDLSATGTVTTAAGARGSDTAAAFAGAGVLSVASNTTLQVPSGGGNHCVFGWAYINSNTGSQYLVAKWNNSSAPQQEHGVVFTSGVIQGRNGGTSYTIASSFAPTAGAWHFYRLWRDDSDGKVRIQIDNGTIYASAGASNPSPTTNALQFGRVSGGFGLTGRLQRWGWIKGDYLTDAEAAYLYAAGAGVTYPELVAAA